ncbi:nucleotide exchange factor GrpE [Mycoplasmopsis felifaucium]|uniref:nucleotide exchange factor GrpE n=1 Tax=Mycoplasmopsis felifaucium TaxID=35768 RepID=UPI00068B85CD|nr:nucleotide exchange factor GrpE [Mycoplasmopsis felifaucium]
MELIKNNILNPGDQITVDIEVYNTKNVVIKKLSKNDITLVIGQDDSYMNVAQLMQGLEIKDLYDFSIQLPKEFKKAFLKLKNISLKVVLKKYTEKKIVDLENEINRLQNEIDCFKAKEEKNKADEEAKNKISELQQFISDLTSKLSDKDFMIKELNVMIDKLKEEIKLREQAPKAVVVPKEMKQEIEKFALQKFFEDFISYYKFFKLSANKAQEDADNSNDDKLKAFAKGNKMIAWQFDELLKKYGLNEVMPVVGEQFDPSYQKINELIEDDTKPNNTILKVHSSAYKLHDRVISVAVVDASKK